MNGLSNYPPGVTGHEPQIAGGVGLTATVTCGREEYRTYPAYAVDDLIADLQRACRLPSTLPPEKQIARIANIVAAAQETLKAHEGESGNDCTFEGEVDGEVFGRTFWWTCPICGDEHEDDRFFEPDPDAGRDD